MAKRWRMANYDPVLVERLQRMAQVNPVVAQLLLSRGIDCPTRAREFIDAKLSGLRDPDDLPGALQAAEVICRAARDGKSIVIYGDYDADGMTATAILLRCLRLLKAKVSYYVPHRLDEGYGLNCEALDQLAARGAQLVVTVDNGIASLAEAEHARRLGLQLVITDHHQMRERLPEADVLVHPALPGTCYPFPGLCGAAVALKVAWAICREACGERQVSPAMRNMLLDGVSLAAIGTVADVVPLVDENRVLVRQGLATLSARPPVGIEALLQVANMEGKERLAGDDIAFMIAPRLNAAGRLGQADLGVELLSTEDSARAAELATYINDLNGQRQTLERSVLLAARKQVKQQCNVDRDGALVLADHDWHAGVIGIVAGKLVEQYDRPVVLISQDKLGVRPGIGSGRSVAGFDLHRALAECSEHLVSHGGHAAAAGLRIEASKVESFRRAFCEVAGVHIVPEERCGEIVVDAEAPFAALTQRTVADIDQLAPFGHGNRRPMLCAGGVRLAAPPKLMGGNGRHLAVDLQQDGIRLRGVAFGCGDWAEELNSVTSPLSIAFQPVINHFRGRSSVELHLADWKRDES